MLLKDRYRFLDLDTKRLKKVFPDEKLLQWNVCAMCPILGFFLSSYVGFCFSFVFVCFYRTILWPLKTETHKKHTFNTAPSLLRCMDVDVLTVPLNVSFSPFPESIDDIC